MLEMGYIIDLGGGYMGMYIVKNSSNWPLKIHVLHYMLNYSAILKSRKPNQTK